MTTHEIDRAPAYEALSYTWGPAIMHHIECEDASRKSHHIAVSENLWLALQRLRHGTKERVLGIDALYINQTDKDEKSLQILLMRTIYYEAESVLVWLGEESQNSFVAFDLISHLVVAATTERDCNATDAERVLRPSMRQFRKKPLSYSLAET